MNSSISSKNIWYYGKKNCLICLKIGRFANKARGWSNHCRSLSNLDHFPVFNLINQAWKDSVLVLNSNGGWKDALLFNSDGEQQKVTCFERDDKTEAFLSCSVNWNNQLFIFGGKKEKRQISRLTGHKLEKVQSLDFDHKQGACSVMASKFIFLCFNTADSNDLKRCRRSTGPLEPFEPVSLSNHNHGIAQTSCSDSKSLNS